MTHQMRFNDLGLNGEELMPVGLEGALGPSHVMSWPGQRRICSPTQDNLGSPCLRSKQFRAGTPR